MPVFQGAPLYNQNAITFLGDSRLAQQFNDAPTNQNTSAYNFFPVSQWLMGQRLRNAGCFAVTGLRSDQYLAAGYVSQAFATNAYWLMIYGITNDVSQNGAAVDYWNATIKPVALAWIASGRKVILPTETGQNGFNANATAIGAVTKYNRQIRQFCQENPNAVLFDVASLVMDLTQPMTILAANSVEGVHINTVQGAFIVGQAFANLMSPLVPAYAGMVATKGEIYANGGVQWFPNPLFTTTSGGTLPTGWTGTAPLGVTGGYVNSGGAAVMSAQAGVYGNDMKLALTSGGVGAFNVQLDLTNIATENPGDIFTGNCEVSVGAGASGLQSVQLLLQSYRNSAANTVSDGITPNTDNGNFPSTAQTLDLQIPPLTIQSGTRGWLTGNLNMYFNAAGSATILVRRMAFWRRQV